MEWPQLAVGTICTVVVTLMNFEESTAYCSALKLIVALPIHHGSELTASWERGLEILPGAQIAADSINNSSAECQLQLIEVNTGQCGVANNFNLLEQFVQLINLSHEHVGAVGLFCNTEFQLLVQSPFDDTKGHIFRVAAITALPSLAKPATTLIRALFRFMKALNWQKLGVVTESRDTYFSHTAEVLYREAKQDPNIDVVMYHQVQVHNRVTNPFSKIIFVSASLPTTVDILCNAHQKNLMWPKHVWILHSYLLDDIINLNTSCFINKALENVLFVRKQTTDNIFGDTYDDFNRKYQLKSPHSSHTNPNSILLHNLVWVMALNVLNLTSTNLSIPEHGMIKITQFRNNTEIPIALISNEIRFTDDQIRRMMISDELPVQFEGASTKYTLIFSIEIVVGFMLVTTMLIGYIYFRNEPEVKSTSFMLSLLIFLGCYLNLTFLSLLLYFHQPILISDEVLNVICGIFPWISGLGLSTSLIIATVIVKLARVYHIFSRFSAKPLGKKSSDLFLAGYVLLILSPMLLILTTWTLVDRFKITFRPSSHMGFIQKQCLSAYLTAWLPLLVLYVVVLFLILVVVAIRSRKIRDKNFKDTKKVNMFIFCLFFDILLPLSYWWLLENLGTSVTLYVAAIPLHIGHFGIILLCLSLLILPKLLTPLSRCIKESTLKAF